MVASRTFRLNEITKILGVKRHFIINLVATGRIKPLVDVRGRGKSRTYSYRNLIEIGVFFNLTRVIPSYAIAKKVLKELDFWFDAHPNEQGWPKIYIKSYVSGQLTITSMTTVNPESEFSQREGLAWDIERELRQKRGAPADFALCLEVNVGNVAQFINSRIA